MIPEPVAPQENMVIKVNITRLLPAVIILVAALAGYGHLLAGDEVLYSPHSDFVAGHLGTKAVLWDSLVRGEGIPYWRADQFAGFPAITNPQGLYTFPLHLPFLLVPPLRALGPTLVLHFLVAGLSFYLLGAVLGLGRWARLFMAVAGLFGVKLILATYAGWLPYLGGVVFLPLLIAAFLHLVDRPSLPRLLGLAAVGALALQTGHLQPIYYGFLFLVSFQLVRTVRALVLGRGNRAAGEAGWLVGAALLAVGAAAHQLLPLAGESALLSRGTASYDFFLAGHTTRWEDLLTLLHPEALGSCLDGTYPRSGMWEGVAYFGLLSLLLIVPGVLLGRRRRFVPFFGLALVVSLVLTADTPVLRVLYDRLPGFALFRCPIRFLFPAALCGTVLAGVGLQEVLDRLRRPRWQLLVAGSLILVTGAEGVYYARKYLETAPHETVLPRAQYQAALAKDRSLFRVAPFDRIAINYGWAAPMGLQLITGFDSYNLAHYHRYFDLLQWGRARREGARVWADLGGVTRYDLLDALNVRYLVSPRPLVLPPDRLRLAGYFEDEPIFIFYRGMRKGPIYLYRNDRAKTRAFFPGSVISAADEAGVLNRLEAGLPEGAVVVAGGKGGGAGDPADAVEIRHAGQGRLGLRVSCRRGRLLVISEVWHPGWRATCPGGSLPLLRVNHALMGVRVPPGNHEIDLAFTPRLWIPALAITGATLAAFIALGVVCIRRRGTGRRPEGGEESC